MKFAISSAYLVAGILLESTGFDDKILHQSASTLFGLRFWEICLPALLCGVGYFLLSNYPLTENRAYEIKQLLAQRHEVGDPARPS